jgi:hypothetical protein
MHCESSILGLPSSQVEITLRGLEGLISLRPPLVDYIPRGFRHLGCIRNRLRLTMEGLDSKPIHHISGIYC